MLPINPNPLVKIENISKPTFPLDEVFIPEPNKVSSLSLESSNEDILDIIDRTSPCENSINKSKLQTKINATIIKSDNAAIFINLDLTKNKLYIIKNKYPIFAPPKRIRNNVT